MGGSVSLVNGHIDTIRSCENCVYYDTDRTDQPCCSCVQFENWEMMEDESDDEL